MEYSYAKRSGENILELLYKKAEYGYAGENKGREWIATVKGDGEGVGLQRNDDGVFAEEVSGGTGFEREASGRVDE